MIISLYAIPFAWSASEVLKMTTAACASVVCYTYPAAGQVFAMSGSHVTRLTQASASSYKALNASDATYYSYVNFASTMRR